MSDSDCSVTAAGLTPKLPVTVDTKGRVRTSKEQRRVILREFEGEQQARGLRFVARPKTLEGLVRLSKA